MKNKNDLDKDDPRIFSSIEEFEEVMEELIEGGYVEKVFDEENQEYLYSLTPLGKLMSIDDKDSDLRFSN